MSQAQSGILSEHCHVAIQTEANMKGEVDVLRATSRALAGKPATFETKFLDAYLDAVIAFGNDTRRALGGGVGAEELKDFPGYGKGLTPTTQPDVLIHILPLRHGVNFSVAQVTMGASGDCIEMKEETYGFHWVGERDPSGFVDDTENPVDEKTRRGMAVIRNGVDTGGSYVFVQCWGHNLKQLSWMNVHDQEVVIGCTKEASEEIDGGEYPETSHLIRVDLKEDDKGLKTVHQSLPYGTTSGTYGLYFCVYCARSHNTKQQLLSMFDDTDDKCGVMLRFTKPVTGGYYLTPSLDKLMVL